MIFYNWDREVFSFLWNGVIFQNLDKKVFSFLWNGVIFRTWAGRGLVFSGLV